MRIFNILVIILITFGFLSSGTYANCDATYSGPASQFLKDCANSPINAIQPDQGGDGPTAIKALVIDISKKMIAFGALFAIGAIVFSAIQYTISYGDDEKVKKAKTTGIYAIIGICLLLIAFPLVDIMVNFIYSLSA